MVKAENKNPLDEVVSSTLLGSPDYIKCIKGRFLSGKKPEKDLLALKELVEKSSVQDIFDEVESAFERQPSLARNVKMYLCQKYTGEKLKYIGTHFGIGESGVSQASRQVADKMSKDKKLRRKIGKIEKKLNLSRMKTY